MVSCIDTFDKFISSVMVMIMTNDDDNGNNDNYDSMYNNRNHVLGAAVPSKLCR